jgi:hypothetical protein
VYIHPPPQEHNDREDRSVEDDGRFHNQTTDGTATPSWSQELALPPRPTAPSPSSSFAFDTETSITKKSAAVTTKSRPTLASLFQSAGRKALKRDEFRKDSYRREEPAQHQPAYQQQQETFLPSSSVPSTPLRKRFLALKSLNAADFLTRSAKSSPAPPLPTIATPSSPIVPLHTHSHSHHHHQSSLPSSLTAAPVPMVGSNKKGKENAIPTTPILRRKRSSLPTPSRPETPSHQHHHHHHHSHSQPHNHQHHHYHHSHDHYSHEHGYDDIHQERVERSQPMMNGRSGGSSGIVGGGGESSVGTRQQYNPNDFLDVPNPYAVRRSRSDSKHKRSHSPGLTTSIKVPGPPPQHHPHPHPFFPCDTPLDRGLLSLPSFDFERPLTRPSTPGQSIEYLPLEKGGGGRKSKLRQTEIDSSINDEIRSVLAAGTEARRERRAPNSERLRVIGPMHRQNIPDVTGGDDQLSPDPTMEPVMMMSSPASQPVNIPSSSRSRNHMAHGLLPFESPAATPYGSKIDLPLTPPASKSRRGSLPQQQQPQILQQPFTPITTTHRSHHRHFSSTTTAVASPPPVPPKDHRPSVEYPDKVLLDEEMGILKEFARSATPPKLYTGFKPIKEKRSALPYTPMSTYDQHQPKPVVVDHNPTIQYRKGSMDYGGREQIVTPSSSYRQQHFHSQSLSGSTVQGGGGNGAYPTPAQSPAGLGISLYSEQTRPLSKQVRFDDLREALKFSLADSRYRSFERGKYRSQLKCLLLLT